MADNIKISQLPAAAVLNWADIVPIVSGGVSKKTTFSDIFGAFESEKEYVTPEMFGAVGDGETDDTEAVQACITNGAIILCKKTYLLTEPLDFTNKHDITFLGGNFVRPIDETFNTIVGNYAFNIKIIGAEFDGNGNSRDITYTWKDNIQGCILLASDCHKIYIEKCTIKNYNYGVFIVGAGTKEDQNDITNVRYDGKIDHCTLINCHSAIDTYGKGFSITNNFIFNNTEHAIQVEPYFTAFPTTDNIINDTENFYAAAVGFNVENNTIINCAGIGINIQPGSYCGSVINNNIINFAEGIRVQKNAMYVNVTNNNLWYQKTQTIDGSKRPYSYVPSIKMHTSGNVIGNSIKNCIVGILLQDTTFGTCSGNIIDNPEISGISAYSISNCIVTNNVVTNFVRNTSAWYGCLPACLFSAIDCVFDSNILKTDGNANSIYMDGNCTTIGGNYTTKEQSDNSSWVQPNMYKSGGTNIGYTMTKNTGVTGTINVNRNDYTVIVNGTNIVSTNEVLASSMKNQYKPISEINFVAIASDGTTKRGWISTAGDVKISGVNDGKSYNFNVVYTVKK